MSERPNPVPDFLMYVDAPASNEAFRTSVDFGPAEPGVQREYSTDREHWRPIPESGLIEGLEPGSHVWGRSRYVGSTPPSLLRCKHPNCERPAAKDYCDEHVTAL